MSEWIRPDGCEGGSCVEYRTVGNAVFVRNSTDEDRMLEFTAAEWDTFVAGLTAPLAAELAGAHTIAQRANARAETLAADLERVRTELAAATRHLALAEKHSLRDEADMLRIVRQRDRAAAGLEHLTEALNQRDAAIAEAAVLRHRDRRTQAVVEAAVALHAADAAGTPWSVWRDAKRAYVAAVDAFVKGPTEPPASTLPAEQPQPVGQPTDGPEPQGGAQGFGYQNSSGGEVPEAGRAGEARAICPDTSWPCGPPCDACTQEQAGEAQTKAQDRTEVGLDAAIEAAVTELSRLMDASAYGAEWDLNAMREIATAAVRAASPLIERAALNAAADEIEGRAKAAIERRNALHVTDETRELLTLRANVLTEEERALRARATRTETP